MTQVTAIIFHLRSAEFAFTIESLGGSDRI